MESLTMINNPAFLHLNNKHFATQRSRDLAGDPSNYLVGNTFEVTTDETV
jgi:hypothetical protein